MALASGRAVPPPDGGGPGELARQECHVVPDAPILRRQGQGLPGGLQGLAPPPGVVYWVQTVLFFQTIHLKFTAFSNSCFRIDLYIEL